MEIIIVIILLTVGFALGFNAGRICGQNEMRSIISDYKSAIHIWQEMLQKEQSK